MRSIDTGWEQFFQRTNCLEVIRNNGHYTFSANELQQITRKQPRLLAKIDTKEELPEIFRDNNLSILPYENGKYIVFSDPDYKSFFNFDRNDLLIPIETYYSRVDLQRYDTFPGFVNLNESQSLDFGLLSSLLETYISQEQLNLTIRGRNFSGDFNFRLPPNDFLLNVSSVQIEIDGGYESENKLVLIEAKTSKRDNFHIRQLYYPYLEWKRRTNKEIIPVLMVFSNRQYFIYQFEISEVFGGFRLVEKRCVSIIESPLQRILLPDLIREIEESDEPTEIPFPQADDLDKVTDVVTAIKNGFHTRDRIAHYFEFDSRQGDYYANAARYLGLVAREDHVFNVTELGDRFFREEQIQRRTRIILEEIIKKPSFREIINLFINHNFELNSISNQVIESIISRHTNLSGSTPLRRASTVKSWLIWIVNHINMTS